MITQPNDSELGESTSALNPRPTNGLGGEVPRTLRIALLAADTVQPYVEWESIGLCGIAVSLIDRSRVSLRSLNELLLHRCSIP